jgi:hypothetical protein
MQARIYQPARNAMQSGQGKGKTWILEFAPANARSVDPLMGWTSSNDMNSQVRLTFESKQAAIDYASGNQIEAVVQEPKQRQHNIRKMGYSENFSTRRREVWTH